MLRESSSVYEGMMRSILASIFCGILAFNMAGCASSDNRSDAESHRDSLRKQGYGYGNEKNAAAARERVRRGEPQGG